MTRARDMLARAMRATGHDPATIHLREETPQEPVISALERLRARNPAITAEPPQERLNAIAAPLTGNALFEAFVKLAQEDRTYLDRLAHRFEFKAPFTKAKAIGPCPMVKARAIEITLGDNGAPKRSKSKDQREREEREPIRFSGPIQINTTSTQVSKPDWRGRLEFRNGKRAVADARKHRREGNFSESFEAFVGETVEQLADTDAMFGFLRASTDEQGSPNVSGFLFIASRQSLIDRQPAMIIFCVDDAGTAMIELPAFDDKTSKGKALGGSFVMQCRATTKSNDWSTGSFKLERK